MFDLQIWFYLGIVLCIVGSLAVVWGPGVKDPIIRTINTEVPSIGVSLIFLSYNHTIAIITFIATTMIITLVLFRAITRLEELGADV
ncbi:EhaE family protein [Methanobrevibacter sp. UBA412]|jgi:energy-converting hydrogenase A subunit E|uniref:EhaE family protein n=1 Tax=Methanobrevibacter sp. UBA412 TaxID=1915486 RepID=UPI0039B824EA